ncbi:GDP-L-fucose synthase [Oxalobacteraceae bacterium R-40]|uniref:GDP-L-fucose synthase n=1 Tax=Keguizhuia sedimenti TaxID=3064264 RepID=A0ABU1BPE7_9BURK|nr:GDP-L-fucose synthase [Oxalobacteraceae bacterium R-40]
MDKNAKIFVAGHRGMVGSAIVRCLQAKDYRNVITRTHSELDLTCQQAVREFFKNEKIDEVYLAAAKVGGIYANNTYPAEFIYQNLMIEANVIHEAYSAGVGRVLFLGSSCIYPRLAKQPIKEEYLLSDHLEPTNEPYAIAKIAGIKLCESYNRQYGADFRSLMPTNLYGPDDNYHPENSHVIPGLIKRFHEAKMSGASEVLIWGTGRPLREFLYVDDLARACIHVMEVPRNLYDAVQGKCASHLNVGSGEEIRISELAALVAETVGYTGEIAYDLSKPDGTPRKLLDTRLLNQLGWSATTSLREGLKHSYVAYKLKNNFLEDVTWK